jgi:hypothetical protein
MATNGTDPQQIVGWNVQSNAPAPYSQPGITASTAALTTTGNGSPGAAYPPSNNTSAANTDQILANPGYADASPSLIQHGTALAASLVPVPASGTAFANPVALACNVTVSGGTVTEVMVNGVQVGAGDGTYVVPGGGAITLVYSAAPAWTWTTR